MKLLCRKPVDARSPADFVRDDLFLTGSHVDVQAGSVSLAIAAIRLTREDQLLAEPLEPTNEWCAVAKIAGMKVLSGLPASTWRGPFSHQRLSTHTVQGGAL